jgi:transposase
LAAELGAAALPLAVVNPRQVREFARAIGQLAKNDALDARMLALFAERARPQPRPLPNEQERELKALVARRRDLVELLTAERNRLANAPAALRKEIAAHIRWREARLKERDRELDAGGAPAAVARARESAARSSRHRPGAVRDAFGRVARTGPA